jgi:hypothetical protein
MAHWIINLLSAGIDVHYKQAASDDKSQHLRSDQSVDAESRFI